VNRLEHEHTADAIARRIASSKHNYIRDFIYGGIDGAVTTFAVVSGVAGAELSTTIILILGFANLVADLTEKLRKELTIHFVSEISEAVAIALQPSAEQTTTPMPLDTPAEPAPVV